MVASVIMTAHDTTPTVSSLVRPIGNLGSALCTCMTDAAHLSRFTARQLKKEVSRYVDTPLMLVTGSRRPELHKLLSVYS